MPMGIKHHIKSEKFFSKEERELIKKATVNVESRTIGEIAVMVVDHSGLYREAEIIGSVLSCSFISFIVTEILFHISETTAEFFFYSTMWFFIPLAVILFFPIRALFKKIPSLKFAFVGKNRKEEAVKERALRAFYEKGLYKTKQNTGVLFFLSLLERKVWVLADKGIHGKIHQNTLNRFANIVSNGIKEGRACEALCEAIMEAGELLAKHFPAVDGDVDELPDDVMFDAGKETE
jgi:putative membrane protein